MAISGIHSLQAQARLQTVLLLQEQQPQYAKLGDQIVSLMGQLVCPLQPVLRIQLKLLVQIQELMEHVSG